MNMLIAEPITMQIKRNLHSENCARSARSDVFASSNGVPIFVQFNRPDNVQDNHADQTASAHVLFTSLTQRQTDCGSSNCYHAIAKSFEADFQSHFLHLQKGLSVSKCIVNGIVSMFGLAQMFEVYESILLHSLVE